MPLSTIVAVYSFSFVAVAFLFYTIINYILKNQVAALTMLLILVTGMSKSYYRPTSESNLALFAGLLLYAWLEYSHAYREHKQVVTWRYPIALLIIVLGYFSHPLAVFYLSFPLWFHALDRQVWKEYHPLLLTAFLGFLFGSRILLADSATHEGSIYAELLVSPGALVDTLTSSYVLTFIRSYYVELYIPFTLILLIAILRMMYLRYWSLLAYCTVFAVIYFCITCISYHRGESDMQMEKILLPLTLFFGLPFSRFFLTHPSHKYMGALVLTFLLLVGITRIDNVRYLFHKRLEYYHALMEQTQASGYRKTVVNPEHVQRHLLRYHWASGVESLLISSLDGPDSSSTLLITDQTDRVKESLAEPDKFIPIVGWTVGTLNADYFSLPEVPYYVWVESFE